MEALSLFHPTQYRFRHYDGDGRLLWASGLGDVDKVVHRTDAIHEQLTSPLEFLENSLANQGEQAMLDAYLRGAAGPTNFYFGLYNDTPVATDTLASLVNEVSGTGYARIQVTRDNTGWPTLALDSGDYKATSATKTFTAGGTWTDATVLVLNSDAASGTSGVLVAYVSLSATRTLQNGDTLDVDIAVKLQGGA